MQLIHNQIANVIMRTVHTVSAALLATAFAATASDIDWDYFEFEYIGVQFEDGADAKGVGASVFYNPFGQIVLSGNFEYLSAEDIFDGGDIDLYSVSIGTGYYWPVQNNLHLVAEVIGNYSWDEFDDDEFGVAVGPGVRWGATDRIELYTSAYYTYGEEFEGGVDVAAGTIIDLTDRLSFITGYVYGDGDDGWYAGLQFPF